jgi:hypothetical protein
MLLMTRHIHRYYHVKPGCLTKQQITVSSSNNHVNVYSAGSVFRLALTAVTLKLADASPLPNYCIHTEQNIKYYYPDLATVPGLSELPQEQRDAALQVLNAIFDVSKVRIVNALVPISYHSVRCSRSLCLGAAL